MKKPKVLENQEKPFLTQPSQDLLVHGPVHGDLSPASRSHVPVLSSLPLFLFPSFPSPSSPVFAFLLSVWKHHLRHRQSWDKTIVQKKCSEGCCVAETFPAICKI